MDESCWWLSLSRPVPLLVFHSPPYWGINFPDKFYSKLSPVQMTLSHDQPQNPGPRRSYWEFPGTGVPDPVAAGGEFPLPFSKLLPRLSFPEWCGRSGQSFLQCPNCPQLWHGRRENLSGHTLIPCLAFLQIGHCCMPVRFETDEEEPEFEFCCNSGHSFCQCPVWLQLKQGPEGEAPPLEFAFWWFWFCWSLFSSLATRPASPDGLRAGLSGTVPSMFCARTYGGPVLGFDDWKVSYAIAALPASSTFCGSRWKTNISCWSLFSALMKLDTPM